MKKIVFLIDEIDKAKKMIRYAALFAKDINAKVHVLHVQYPLSFGAQAYTGVAGATIHYLKTSPKKLKKKLTDLFVKLKLSFQ